jgi:hypothetical protein
MYRSSVDIVPFILEEGIRRGGQSEWERAFAAYMTTNNPSEKYVILTALAATRHGDLINRYMRMCLDDQIVKPNMLPKAIGALMSNKMAVLPLWRFFRKEYDAFDEMYV